MKRINKSLILFHNPAFGLDEAHELLAQSGYTTTRQDDSLTVQWQDGPQLYIRLALGQAIQNETVELAKGTPYVTELSRFDALFEITFDDLDEVLDEINTLIEVQASLQDATQGFLFNTWNKELSAPEN